MLRQTGDLTNEEFRRIADFAHARAGLVLEPCKRAMVQGRLTRRLRALGLRDFSSYLEHLSAHPREEDELISILTTNVTDFFREPHHFDHFGDAVLPDLARRAVRGGRVRIWSAGCSGGHEPFSLAMLSCEALRPCLDADFRILATDIDTHVLEEAERGIYTTREAGAVPETLRNRYLTLCDGGKVRVHSDLQRLITFRVLNLLDDWPMQGHFDVIFCRNVLIYFDSAAQAQVLERMRNLLVPGGHLYLGHSERLCATVRSSFKSCAITGFQRTLS